MRIIVAVIPLFAVACGAPPPPPSDTLDERVEIPDAPTNGLQLVMPESEIGAGEDKQLCWVGPAAGDTDQLIESAVGFQGKAGHHTFVFTTVIPRHAGDIFDCTASEAMVTIKPLMAPLVGKNIGLAKLVPDGYAIRLKAGQQIVIQSHYVNVNTKPIKVRDVVNVNFTNPGESRIEAGYFTMYVDGMSIPAGDHSVIATTTIPTDIPALGLLGHMHEWGKSFSLVRGGETLYSVESWNASLRDSPPVNQYPPATPLVLHTGDVLTTTCEYNNDTGAPLTDPHEMCVYFGSYAPVIPGSEFIQIEPDSKVVQ